MLSSGYYDAYFQQAQRARRLISQDFANAFTQVDAMLTPCTPEPAFQLGSKPDPISLYLSDIFTIATNCAGLPAISMPNGFINNLPMGVQLIGKHFQEQQLLNFGHQFQTQTDWHQQQPAHINNDLAS